MYVVITNHLLTWATWDIFIAHLYLLDGTLVWKMGHLHMASCELGVDLRHKFGVFHLIHKEDDDGRSATRTQFVVSKDSSVRGGQRINNGVPGLDSVLQSRPLGDF